MRAKKMVLAGMMLACFPVHAQSVIPGASAPVPDTLTSVDADDVIGGHCMDTGPEPIGIRIHQQWQMHQVGYGNDNIRRGGMCYDEKGRG